jgi:hypothetical protein
MPEQEVVAEGMWCRDCEFFEDAEFDPATGTCYACGCGNGRHVDAKVVVDEC